MEKIRHQIVQVINRSERILLMPSSPVDGDSLGSSLALYLLFKKLGKQVTVVCADPIPDAFDFLPTTKVISHDFKAANDFIVTLDCEKAKLNTIHTKLEHDKFNIIITAKKGQFSAQDVSFHHGPSKYDLIITVDTADLSQLGRFYEDNTQLFTEIPVINIDHHASNDYFGKINYVDIMASATTELLIPLVQEFEAQTGKQLMDEDIATLLLAGIITDTGSFQHANTTPRSFASAAYLIKHGARQQEIIQHIFKTKHLSTLKLWGRILSKMKIDRKYHIVWSSITAKDFQDTGAVPDETGSIIDELLSNAPESEVVLLLKQKEEDVISGSLRSHDAKVDVSQIAEMLGGGGHTQAAGFKLKGHDMDSAEAMVLEKIRDFQTKRKGGQVAEVPAYLATETEEGGEEQNNTKKTDTEPKIEQQEESKQEPEQTNQPQDFTEFVIRTNLDDESEGETPIEEGVVYKFEE